MIPKDYNIITHALALTSILTRQQLDLSLVSDALFPNIFLSFQLERTMASYMRTC